LDIWVPTDSNAGKGPVLLRPCGRRAAEKHGELAPQDLAVPRASSASPCAMPRLTLCGRPAS